MACNTRKPKKLFWLVLLLLGSLLIPTIGRAGFGISPPFIVNKQLFPGSHYEQKINLLRSSAEEDLEVEIKINAPEIASWIKVDKGEKFILPKGQFQVPMTVMINPPKNADLGNYKGNINVRVAPNKTPEGGGVAIALGARIDIDLTLTNVSFADFLVRLVSVPDFEVLEKPWNWKIFSRFFYRIKVVMNIQNKGNVPIGPSKVHIDVYDISNKTLLQSSDDKKIKPIEAFETGQAVASFPTNLPPGQYWAAVKIYKDNEVVNSYKLGFTIYNQGENPGGPTKLGYFPWLMMGGLILAGLATLLVLLRLRAWRLITSPTSFLLVLILRPIVRTSYLIYKKISDKFWKWISKKASKYNQEK